LCIFVSFVVFSLVCQELLCEPEFQRSLLLRWHLHKPNADIAALVLPDDFGLRAQFRLGSGKLTGDLQSPGIKGTFGRDPHAALTDVDQVRVQLPVVLVLERDGYFNTDAVIAQAFVEDHAAGRRQRAHSLLDGYGFFEGEQGAALIQTSHPLAIAHDDQGNDVELSPRRLQFTEQLARSIQVAIYDEGVNF
jgi:hypothetical protein